MKINQNMKIQTSSVFFRRGSSFFPRTAVESRKSGSAGGSRSLCRRRRDRLCSVPPYVDTLALTIAECRCAARSPSSAPLLPMGRAPGGVLPFVSLSLPSSACTMEPRKLCAAIGLSSSPGRAPRCKPNV